MVCFFGDSGDLLSGFKVVAVVVDVVEDIGVSIVVLVETTAKYNNQEVMNDFHFHPFRPREGKTVKSAEIVQGFTLISDFV